MQAALEHTIDAIMESQTLQELEKLMIDVIANFGFAAATYADMSAIPIGEEPDPYYVTSLPQDFVAAYADGQFAGFDPVIRQASASNAPFLWTDCMEYRHALQPHRGKKGRTRHLVELANDFRYRDGYVVPLHARDGQGRPRSALLSLYWQGNIQELYRPNAIPHWFRLIAQVYHERVLALRATNEDTATIPTLTDRERECLVWACRGKTSGETADILSISERTVEFHILNAMRKLGVYNKVHCVAVAVQLGLVSP